MNPYQWWIALVVIVGLFCILCWYVRSLYSSPNKPGGSAIVNRQQRVQHTIQQFQQQPTLESARVNFLRQLPYDECHDLIMIALASVNYIVYMDVVPRLYELPALEITEPDPAILVGSSTENGLTYPGSKGRLVNSMKSVIDRLEPIVESDQVFTVDGQPVFVSIQIESASYSRYGLNRLSQVCQLENQPGLLVCLGTAPTHKPTVSPVVILTGSELIAILEGLSC